MSGPDISNIFPVNDMEKLSNFMSNCDGEFHRRKLAFEMMLHQLATTKADQKNFANLFIHALFDRKWLMDVKWPSAK